MAWLRLLRLAFRLLYQELAWTYDAVSWLVSLGDWRSWQLAAVPHVQGGRVLELAHGPGHLLLALERAGIETFGCDQSPQMVRMAARRLRRSGERVRLVRARAQTLPFAPAAFDTIVVTFPAEFITAPATIRCLYRCVRPGGRVVIVPEAQLTRGGLLRHFIDFLYAVTGQRGTPSTGHGPSLLWQEAWARYEAAGFELAYRVVNLQRSQVVVIVATRPASLDSEKLVQ